MVNSLRCESRRYSPDMLKAGWELLYFCWRRLRRRSTAAQRMTNNTATTVAAMIAVCDDFLAATTGVLELELFELGGVAVDERVVDVGDPELEADVSTADVTLK
jgi:hypothetical protein